MVTLRPDTVVSASFHANNEVYYILINSHARNIVNNPALHLSRKRVALACINHAFKVSRGYIAPLRVFIAVHCCMFTKVDKYPFQSWNCYTTFCTACEQPEHGVGHRCNAMLGFFPCYSWLSICWTQSPGWPSVRTAGERSSTAFSSSWFNYCWGMFCQSKIPPAICHVMSH